MEFGKVKDICLWFLFMKVENIAEVTLHSQIPRKTI